MTGRSRPKSAKHRAKPVKSRQTLSNSAAIEEVIEALYERDALGKVHSATVAIARTLALRLDGEDAKNARLWKEYRETVATLMAAGEERVGEFDETLRSLEASLRNTANV
jgi:hypothetical protein